MEPEIRVLHVLRPAEGGMLSHLSNLFACFDSRRYRLGIAAPKAGRAAEILSPYDAEFHHLEIAASLSPLVDAFALFRLERIVSCFKPDIIHAHGIKAALVARLCGLLHRSTAMVVTLHNITDCSSLSPAKRRLFLKSERILLPHTDGIIAVSEAVSRSYIDLIPEAKEKIRVIHNGIDVGWGGSYRKHRGRRDLDGGQPERSGLSEKRSDLRTRASRIRSDLGIQASTFCIGLLARLIQEKGIGDMIDAARLLRDKGVDFAVLIAGDGPSKDEFTDKASSSGLDGIVHFLGFRDDTEELLSVFDLLILPTWNDGFPMTLLEAMRAACPVVATQTGGIPEMVENGVSGFLLPPRSPERIAELLYMLSKNREMLDRVAESALTRVKNLFSREIMAKGTESFYEDILNR